MTGPVKKITHQVSERWSPGFETLAGCSCWRNKCHRANAGSLEGKTGEVFALRKTTGK